MVTDGCGKFTAPDRLGRHADRVGPPGACKTTFKLEDPSLARLVRLSAAVYDPMQSTPHAETHNQGWPLYQPFHSPQTNTLVGRVAKLIGAMARLSQQHGARFVVVIVPELAQGSAASQAAYGELDIDKP